MDIIFDTNILRSDLLLRSSHFSRLKDYAFKTGAVFILPQIVLEELTALYERELTGQWSLARRALRELNAMCPDPVIPLPPELNVQEAVTSFVAFIRNELSSYYLDEPKYTEQNLREAVQRLVKRIKPVSAKGEEFRDALLWLMILDRFKFSPKQEMAFISDNVSDFGNQTKDDLHDDLRAELKARGLKLHYFRSIKDFVIERVLPMDFITDKWLVAHLPWDEMDALAVAGVEGINAAFYFEYFGRCVSSDEMLQTWRVMSARFDRGIQRFDIGDLSQVGHYGLDIHVGGKARIKFFLENGDVLFKTVYFGTEMGAQIIQEELVSFSLPFYEEESGLAFFV